MMFEQAAESVTQLFTEIEGAAPLVRQFAAGYGGVLAGQHRRSHRALATQGGRELSTKVTSRFVSFAGPLDATPDAREKAALPAAYREPRASVCPIDCGELCTGSFLGGGHRLVLG